MYQKRSRTVSIQFYMQFNKVPLDVHFLLIFMIFFSFGDDGYRYYYFLIIYVIIAM